MKTLLALMLISAGSCLGAIPATTVWEVRTTGSDTNGGGFDGTASPSVDYSQNDSKNASGCSSCGSSSVDLSTTDVVITAASTTVTSATASFTSAVTGNVVYFSGGSCTTGAINTQRRRVAYSNSTTITLDVAPTGTFTGTCTGVTMNIGGAIASPSIVATNKVAGNDVYIKAGTYTLSSTSTSASNGVVLDSTGGTGATNNSIWWGYNSTRGDDGTKPLLQMSGIASVSLFKVTGSHVMVRNLAFDGASGTSIKCVEETGAYIKNYRLKGSNCTNRAFDLNISTNGTAATIEATSNSTTGAMFISNTVQTMNISAHDNTTSGILLASGGTCIYCMSYRNSGASSDGFVVGATGSALVHSVAAYNGRNGVLATGSGANSTMLVNTILYGNATGISTDQVQDGLYLFNSATGANTTSNYNTSQVIHLSNHVALTADPFTNVSSSANGAADFSLNTTAGGGAALRAAGFLGLPASGAAIGHQDIGPIQHGDPAGGGTQKSFTFLQ